MNSLAKKPRQFGAPRLHFEETINADPISVRDTILEIMTRLQGEYPAQSEGIISTEIVLAEVLNNITEHSYEASNLGNVAVSVLCTDDMISIETRDSGTPMPGLSPPENEPADISVDIQDLPEGGFGWFFIRSLSTHMEYKRIGGQNIFCVQIPTSEISAADPQ